MIKCAELRATIPESTCIKRQDAIDLADNPDRANESGVSQAKRNAGFYRVGCQNCKVGLDLFEKSKREIKTVDDKKVCVQCKESYPRTNEYFDEANRSADNLTKACRTCRGTIPSPPEPAKKKKTDPPPVKEPLVQCSDCNAELELNNKNFWKNTATKSGFESRCVKCSRKLKRYQRKTRAGINPEKCIILNLDGYEELHQKIKEWAGDNMRDMDKQIIFHLKYDALAKRRIVS